MQALILAAGKGERLKSLGLNCPKCLTPIVDKTILGRAIDNLQQVNVNKIFIVVNHKADDIISFVENEYPDSDITFVDERKCPQFKRNNLYSFELALSYLNLNEDTILIEGDILFDVKILNRLLTSSKSKVVLSRHAPYLDGNGVKVELNRCIGLKRYEYDEFSDVYKTANIYYLNHKYLKKLKHSIKAFLKTNTYDNYYEEVFNWKEFEPVLVEPTEWYEVDTPSDYYVATAIYSQGKKKYDLLKGLYGAYWRVPSLVDCCYLTNPYFTHSRLTETLRSQLPELVSSYPAGELDCRMNASDLLGINDTDKVLVGNGAVELVSALGFYLKGKKTYIELPTFNEYFKFFDIVENINDAEVIIIINPNNPTGAYKSNNQITAMFREKPNALFIIDESFNDFVEPSIRTSFIGKHHKNVVVVKSLGKSYSVNGLKLGVLYSANKEIIEHVHALLPSWNINGIAQSFLANIKKYKDDYATGCERLIDERKRFVGELSKINGIVAYDTQGDFILAKVDDADKVCVDMLDRYNIFIKNLNDKRGLEGANFIRVSINDEITNDYVIESFKNYYKSSC